MKWCIRVRDLTNSRQLFKTETFQFHGALYNEFDAQGLEAEEPEG